MQHQEEAHNLIKEAFDHEGWKPEEPIDEDSQNRLEKGWRYDAFKEGVAIEIETGSTPYRSILKFTLGWSRGKIDVGVIIVFNDKEIHDYKPHRFSTMEREFKDFFSIIPVPILVVGLYP